MERLTVDYGKEFSPVRYAMKDGSDAEIGYFKNYDAFYSHMLMVQKLGEYEDLEEQDLLFRLPCKVGDTIYRVNTGAKEPVIKMRVLQVIYKQLHKDRIIIRINAMNDNDMGESCYLLEDFGKTVFLTQAEAERKLKEMESELYVSTSDFI